jgi:hypothetical protein
MYRWILPVSALAVFLLGCGPAPQEGGSTAEPKWQVVGEDELTPAQSEKRDRALAARDALFQTLKGRLVEAMGKEGPAEAIGVCKEEAPRLASEVSEEHGVSIGRTSFRLRNPGNQPPSWAEPLVEERVEEPTYLAAGDRLAALVPIRLGPECVMCHGPAEEIMPEVKTALAEQYPDDRATGFEPGDLRGWFWVEVD